jgi:hypothetical protein
MSDVTKGPDRAVFGRKSEGRNRKPSTRETAVLALLTEKTLAAAAKRAGIGERTLRRWVNEDAPFKAEYEAARHAAFTAGISRVQALTCKAVDTLEELLDAKKHPTVRLGAARTIAEIGLHQHDADTIVKKLDEIEALQRKDVRRR